MKKNIIILEDDQDLLLGLGDTLEFEGYGVHRFSTLREIRKFLAGSSPVDLGIFDIELPDGNGLDFLDELEKGKNLFPILFLTVRNREIDVVRALERGGGDFLTKPYRVRELLARVANLLKKGPLQTPANLWIHLGKLIVDFDALMAKETRGDLEVLLTGLEWKLLKYLFVNRGQALPREQILNAIWAQDDLESNRTVDVHIARLRKKFEMEPGNPHLIKTISGVGYRMGKLEGERD